MKAQRNPPETKPDTLSNLEEYLQWMKKIQATMHQGINGYTCFEDFVLRHGIPFKGRSNIPRKWKMGRPKCCYENATKLAMHHPELTYVEGYATTIIPTMHAWCVNRKLEVIDPTWKDGNEYIGIPIKLSYLLKSITDYGVYGLIDLWREGFPMLKANPEEFKKEL